MNLDDREALRELMNGAAFVIGILAIAVFIIAVVGIPSDTSDKRKPEEKFKVVDTYGGCDVIRYTDRSNDWNYFLHCKQ